jgi:tetratricopeptide (TPR) repeat protein
MVVPASARAADSTAPAADTFTETVATHRERGAAHYEAGRFQDAIDEFRKAYEMGAESVFLFEIAQAYRQLSLGERAQFFYQRYLSADPTGPFAAEASRQVEALAPAVPERAETTAPPPPGVDLSASAAPPSTNPDVGRPRQPLWQRWWFWAGFGAVVLTGVGIGALAASGGGTQVPKTDLGHARFF